MGEHRPRRGSFAFDETAEFCRFCVYDHPLQFPLKSFGFPDAETQKGDFSLGIRISRRKNAPLWYVRRRVQYKVQKIFVLLRSPDF